MEVSISARNGSLAPDSQEYIESKVPKLVHIFDRLTSVQVMVDFQKREPQVEILVSAEHKHDFVSSEHNATVESAFDLAVAKMEQQLRKYKEKVQDHHRKSSGVAGEAAK